MRNQSPMHKPTLVAAPVADNDGNRRGDLFRGDIKTRLVQRQIAGKVPADPNVTKLERRGDAATHKLAEGQLIWMLMDHNRTE